MGITFYFVKIFYSAVDVRIVKQREKQNEILTLMTNNATQLIDMRCI